MTMIENSHIDQEVLRKVSEGDEQAFFILFTAYSPLIRPFARKLSKSIADAEDIIQEIFIRVWLHRDKLLEIENFKAWLFTVSARECMRFMKKNIGGAIQLDETNLQESLPDSEYENPFYTTRLNEINAAIKRAVNKMPPKRKLIYCMSREQGLKPSQIAEELSLSVGTVKNVLSRALDEIRDALQEIDALFVAQILFAVLFKKNF